MPMSFYGLFLEPVLLSCTVSLPLTLYTYSMNVLCMPLMMVPNYTIGMLGVCDVWPEVGWKPLCIIIIVIFIKLILQEVNDICSPICSDNPGFTQ